MSDTLRTDALADLLALDDTALTLLIEAVAYQRYWKAYTPAGAVWPLYEQLNGPTQCCLRETELPAYCTDWQSCMDLVLHSGYDLAIDQQADGTVTVRIEGQACACVREPSATAIRRAIGAGIVWTMDQREEHRRMAS